MHAPPDGEVLEHLQRFADVGFWELELGSGDVYWSTQAFAVLGLTEASLEGFLASVHPEDRAVVDAVTRRVVEQPGPYRLRHRTRDGRRTLLHRLQSVGGPDGRPVRLLGVVSDVSAEAGLEARAAASDAARLTGLLAASATHDLKNVLGVVAAQANLALDAAEGGRIDLEALRAIERTAGRGIEIVQDLLRVGRSEAEPAAVDVRDVLVGLEAVARQLLGPGRRLSLALPTVPTPVLVHRAGLERALLDLLVNAGQALPDGAGHVHVYARREEPAAAEGATRGPEVVVGVADDGPGIDPDRLGSLAEPFASGRADVGGSGLGLFAVDRFAREAGGVLAIRNTPTGGAEVELRLPAVVGARTRRRRTPVRLVVLGRRPPAGIPSSVQVVHPAGTGDAVAVLSTEPIDALVLDEPGDRRWVAIEHEAAYLGVPVLARRDVDRVGWDDADAVRGLLGR